MNDESDNNHITISPAILTLLVGAALSGGAGIGGIVTPNVSQKAVTACYDNSRIAIEQANSQGLAIDSIRLDLISRTALRYDTQDAASDRAEAQQEHDLLSKRIRYLERHVEKIERNGGNHDHE